MFGKAAMHAVADGSYHTYCLYLTTFFSFFCDVHINFSFLREFQLMDLLFFPPSFWDNASQYHPAGKKPRAIMCVDMGEGEEAVSLIHFLADEEKGEGGSTREEGRLI